MKSNMNLYELTPVFNPQTAWIHAPALLHQCIASRHYSAGDKRSIKGCTVDPILHKLLLAPYLRYPNLTSNITPMSLQLLTSTIFLQLIRTVCFLCNFQSITIWGRTCPHSWRRVVQLCHARSVGFYGFWGNHRITATAISSLSTNHVVGFLL